MFTHVLMTRFNLATPGREFAIRTRPGWLEQRFDLFERFCLPSVAAQTSRDFHWIIYFDKDTPQEFKDRISRLSAAVFPFVPYYTGLFPAEGWRISVNAVLAPATPLLLTNRLDNDDALACDFVARLQAEVRRQDHAPGAYNFRNGLIRQAGRLYAVAHDSNPFFAFLEPMGPDIHTAPDVHHMKIAEKGPVFQIGGAPAWMQVVHETNVSNRVRGRQVSPAAAATGFAAVDPGGLAPVSTLALALDAGIVSPLRRLRDAAAGLIRGEHARR